MILTFRISYRTQWGETIAVHLIDSDDTIMLSTADGELWEGAHTLLQYTPGEVIRYRYRVYRDEECIREERGTLPHTIRIPHEEEAHYSSLKDKASGQHIQQSALLVSDAWRQKLAESIAAGIIASLG